MSAFAIRLLAGISLLMAASTGIYFLTGTDSTETPIFATLSGPLEPTVVPPPIAANWKQYGTGGTSALAILLTDPDSAWIGLAHGLKTIGVPFLFLLPLIPLLPCATRSYSSIQPFPAACCRRKHYRHWLRFRVTVERWSGNSVSFQNNIDAMRKLLPDLENTWRAWPSFSDIALHGFDID